MGFFVIYFLVYQLVGTDLITNREQGDLRQKLAQEWAVPAPTKRGAPLPVPKPPAIGQALGVIEIPKIDLKKVIVQGANPEELALGPGHIPSTVMPGQPGTFAVSGHRTTHGRPFYRLNELAKGDTITIVTRYAIYTYKVSHFQVVAPTAVEVLDTVLGANGKAKAQIVLTTCNPRFSAAQRLIVFGDLSSSVRHTAGDSARGHRAVPAGALRGSRPGTTRGSRRHTDTPGAPCAAGGAARELVQLRAPGPAVRAGHR